MAKRYVLPPVGTVLPGKESDLDAPSPSDQNAVNAFLQARAQQAVLDHNALLTSDYLDHFGSWLKYTYNTDRAVGPTGKVGDPKAQPPFSPPLSFFAVLTQGEAGVYWDQVQLPLNVGGKMVCKQPAFKKITAPQH